MSEAVPIRILKDGYWDRTTVVQSDDGALRVRKESRALRDPGPWAHAALRNEISFLKAFHGQERIPLPPLLDSWDGKTIGYEIPFYDDRVDFAKMLLAGDVEQGVADGMQSQLGAAVFDGLHSAELLKREQFAMHVREVIRESIDALAGEARFSALCQGAPVEINGRSVPTLSSSLHLLDEESAFESLDATLSVLLHGDLILENILWSPMILIDPVSVAGLTSGHPLFDLVKYESYATGELYAIREELVTAEPAGAGYVFEIDWEHEKLAEFGRLDLCTVFRDCYRRAHGEVDPTLYALIDGYFSLVMARNTTGAHQWARVLKGCHCLASASGAMETPFPTH